MRILITGATSALGRSVAAQLLAAGNRVCGVAQQPHPYLDPGVELACAALGDTVLQELADAADAVIHLAPIEPDAPGGEGIEGVVRVAHCAARAGARLLCVSQAAGDPELYSQAEDLVTSSWAPSLVIRIAPPVGRLADWMVCRTAATLLTTDAARPLRVLHTDDLHRFLLRSVGSHRTGAVDLCTADSVTAATARRWLVPVHRRFGRVDGWPVPDPDLRVVPLHRDWEFECGWTAAEAVADTGRALAGRRPSAAGATTIAGRFPVPVEAIPREVAATAAELHIAAPAAHSGEFDDVIDPRFPVFSTRFTSDALPGPLTPMTLDVQCAGLRAAHRATAELIGMRGALAREWQQRAVAVFAHRTFTGVSACAGVAELLPGSHQDVDPGSPPPSRGPRRLPRPAANAALAVRIIDLSRQFGTWCEEFADAAEAMQLDADGCARLRDAALETRLPLLRNKIQHGWTLAAVGALAEGLLARAAGREHQVVPLLAATTATGHLAAETAALATILRGDPRLRELAADSDLHAIRASFPSAATALDAAVLRIGHRGPGEAELANPVIADSPQHLLAGAALAALDTPAPHPVAGRKPGLAQRRAEAVRVARESAWHTTARHTHQLRLALREKGSRLAQRRVLAAADDIFYLTLDEVLAPPVDARLRVNRRRAERMRLQALNMPQIIDGTWLPVEDVRPPEAVAIIDAPASAPAPALEPQGQACAPSCAGSAGWRDRISALMSSSPSQMFTFMPASTRLSPSSQNTVNSRLSTSPRNTTRS
jgi:hypothetical protein